MPFNNQKGQTLVIVLFVMTLALIIGISISTRFIFSLRNLARTDSSSRALAIAEAGIERMLIHDIEVLKDFIINGTCGDECSLEIIGEDGIRATAAINLSIEGETPDPYPIELVQTDSYEINLVGYPADTVLYICWNDPPVGDAPSVKATFFYGTQGNYLVDVYSYNSVISYYSDNGFDDAVPAHGFGNCFTIGGRSSPQALRLRSLYNDVTAYVVPHMNTVIPSQGVLIVSEGKVSEATRKVTVIKRDPVVPIEFDYILYSKTELEPLTN